MAIARRKRSSRARQQPPPGGAPAGPDPAAAQPAAVGDVPLETFLVACQKSLARAVRSAQQSGKADNEFGLGERPVYMIEGIDIDVSVGVQVAAPKQTSGGEHVLLDFQAPAEARSRIRFRVQSKPVELMRGAKLELSNLDPMGGGPIARLRAWLVDDTGRPVPKAEVELHFARAGDKEPKHVITAATDCAGRVDFFVEPDSNEVKVVGDRSRKRVFLRGGGRGINDDEYFVWATAKRQPGWLTVADFSAPYPPQAIALTDALPAVMCSEMHRLRIATRR
jgi:hypothetical protein